MRTSASSRRRQRSATKVGGCERSASIVRTYRPAARREPGPQRAAVAGLALLQDRPQPASDGLPGLVLDLADHHQDFRLDPEAVQDRSKLWQQDPEVGTLVVGPGRLRSGRGSPAHREDYAE